MGEETRGGRAGFTLIELIVIVAIIILLVAILSPVIARARLRARATQCLSNTRQLGAAMHLYTHDNDDRLFYSRRLPLAPPVDGPQRPPVWTDLMYPYIQADRVMVCPNAGPPPPPWLASYALNNVYYEDARLGRLYDPYGSGPATLAAVESPTSCIFAGDGGKFQPQVVHSGPAFGPNWAMTPPTFGDNENLYGGRFVARHEGGGNFSFFDGHAKRLTPGDLSLRDRTGRVYVRFARVAMQ